MAINKNFVIKNGVQVNTNLIVGDSTTNKVGVGTTTPGYTLHVGGSRGGRAYEFSTSNSMWRASLETLDFIDWKNKYYRKDIAFRIIDK